MMLALLLVVSLITACGTAAAKPKPQIRTILAASYFGEAWPVNFWSSDLSYAPQDFQQIKSNGFNAVLLVVPWGYFQPGVDPASFNQSAFTRLDMLISEAKSAGLGVLLRISYNWDTDPSDQQPGWTRFGNLFTSSTVYNSWLSYIAKLHDNVSHYSNVWGGFISWEDFQVLISEAKGATSLSDRLALAHSVGYDSWLSKNYTLKDVSNEYHSTFHSWNSVPTPLATTPEFSLFYKFWDAELTNKIFEPALQRFPGLTMESRVDEDPLYNGTTQVGVYSHDVTYRLPGTAVTGLYYNPYMGAQGGSIETVNQALAGMKSVLNRVKNQSGGRSLFIYEFQLYDNTPANAGNSHLSISEVPQFINASVPLLKTYTVGYAVWTYRDYNANAISNPSGAIGLTDWNAQGTVTNSSSTGIGSFFTLGNNSQITQTIPKSNGAILNSIPLVDIAFSAKATTAPTQLTVKVGNECIDHFDLSTSMTAYKFTCATKRLTNYNLTVSTENSASVNNIQIYNYTQLGDIYSNTGVAEPGLGPLTSLNKAMIGGKS